MRVVRLVSVAIVAALAAATAPALLFAAFTGSLGMGAFAFIIALPHALVLGLPLFLVLRAKGWVNAGSSLGGGFLVGAIPMAVLTGLGNSDWLTNILAVSLFGVCGATGGLAFFLLWKVFTPAPERSEA